MGRYVDADMLKTNCDIIIGDTTIGRRDYVMFHEIDSAPSIDIVRCKECKHWERLNYEAPKEGWCDDQMPYSDGRWVDADDFCSYGEREGE